MKRVKQAVRSKSDCPKNLRSIHTSVSTSNGTYKRSVVRPKDICLDIKRRISSLRLHGLTCQIYKTCPHLRCDERRDSKAHYCHLLPKDSRNSLGAFITALFRCLVYLR